MPGIEAEVKGAAITGLTSCRRRATIISNPEKGGTMSEYYIWCGDTVCADCARTLGIVDRVDGDQINGPHGYDPVDPWDYVPVCSRCGDVIPDQALSQSCLDWIIDRIERVCDRDPVEALEHTEILGDDLLAECALVYRDEIGRRLSERLDISRRVMCEARCLLNRGWAQGELARDADGKPVEPESPEAVSFCVLGAVIRAARDIGAPRWALDGTLDQIERAVGGDIPAFNDAQKTVDSVLDVIDMVIDHIERDVVGIGGRR